MTKKILILSIVSLLIAGGFGYLKFFYNQAPPANTLGEHNSFDKSQYSLTDPSSIWVIVNKQNKLPNTYKPKLTVPNVLLRLNETEEQMSFSAYATNELETMFKMAKKDKINLVLGSGYRSYNLQEQFYESYVSADGQTEADTYSARPGYSEHQTGLAVDITSKDGKCHLEICWQNTEEGKWMASNAHKYGFIIRYPNNKQTITGYQYEPWHFRYVGNELAEQIYNSKLTLEEFFNYPKASSYSPR